MAACGARPAAKTIPDRSPRYRGSDRYTPPPPANWDAFVQGLREAAYIEGQNVEFEHRSAHDQPELFPKLAFELATLNVNVIFARGTWALSAAKNATRTIPIVGMDRPRNRSR